MPPGAPRPCSLCLRHGSNLTCAGAGTGLVLRQGGAPAQSLREVSCARVAMQLSPGDGHDRPAWDAEETQQFLHVLTRALHTNKAKEVYFGSYSKRRVTFTTMLWAYCDSVFPPRRRLELLNVCKLIPQQVLAEQSSSGTAATLGGCMRSNVLHYSAMSEAQKQKTFEDMAFVSDVCMVALGAVILGLLAGDAVQIYFAYKAALPDLQFYQEFASELSRV